MNSKLFMILGSLMIALALSACPGPYNLKITAINEESFLSEEKSRDAMAAIQISDPTLYAREALVNDRRRERAYLEDVLEESKMAKFESELKRELVDIFALSARLGIAFDPGFRGDYLIAQERNEAQHAADLSRIDIADQQLQAQNRFERERLQQNLAFNQILQQRDQTTLQGQASQQQVANQISLTELQAELELLQARLRDQRRQIATFEQAAEAGEPVSRPVGQGDQETDDGGQSEQPALPTTPLASASVADAPPPRDSGLSLAAPVTLADLPNLRDIGIEVPKTAALVERLDNRISALQQLLGQQAARAQDVDVVLTPEAEFAARQAYRRTIRAALAENDLDDLHDLDGNSLYRLQFRASILPGTGKRKAKWGVARYTIDNPHVTREELDRLYFEWLAHSSYRINARETGKKMAAHTNMGDSRHALLAAGTGLFEIARVNFDSDIGPLSAFDPCRHITSQREIEALGCDSLALAVPPGMRNVVSPALANFEENFLEVVTNRIAEILHKQDTSKEIKLYFESTNSTNKLCSAQLNQVSPGVNIHMPSLESFVNLVKTATSKKPENLFNEYISQKIEKEERYFKGHQEQIQVLRIEKQENNQNKLRETISNKEVETFREAFATLRKLSLQDLKAIIPASRAIQIATDYVLAAPAVAKSAEGATRRYGLQEGQASMLNHLLDTFESGAQTSRRFLRLLTKLPTQIKASFEGCRIRNGLTLSQLAEQVSKGDQPTFHTPKAFITALADYGTVCSTQSQDKCKLRLKGKGYAYTTSPVERNQRLSSIANAANAFEFALALAGKAPVQGIAADAGLGVSRLATGKVQARENAPLVVGFSGPRRDAPYQPNHLETSHFSQFGWVFGPRVRLDPRKKQLRLEQHVGPYDVSADLSVPGWWPRVDLWLDTVWIGNWDTPQVVQLEPKHTQRARRVSVRLRNNRSDMDGLTNELAKQLLGRNLQVTHITRVVPNAVSVCRDTMSLLIYGVNVWRSTEVYLDGVQALENTVSILPDMEGIKASFDIRELRSRSSEADARATLVVWTRDGFDEYRLKLTGRHTDASCVDEKKAAPAAIALASAQPSQISVCSQEVEFVVVVRGLTGELTVVLGGQNHKHVKESDVKNGVIKVKMRANSQLWQGLTKIPLVVYGKDGVVATDILLVGDRSKCNKTEEAQVKPKIKSASTTYGDNLMDVCAPNGTVILTGTGLSQVSYAEWLNRTSPIEVLVKDKKAAFSFTDLPIHQRAVDLRQGEKLVLRLLDANRDEIARHEILSICRTATKKS